MKKPIKLTSPEFAMEMKRLGQVFGNYSPPESQRIYDKVKHLNTVQFRKMCDWFIDHAKKPRVPDFRIKANNFVQEVIGEENYEEYFGLNCEWCHGSGLNEVWGDGFDTNVLIACDAKCGGCRNLGSVDYLPNWDGMLFPNLERRPIDVTQFKPADNDPSGDQANSIVEWHKARLKFAREFWPRFVKRQIKEIDSRTSASMP